MLKIVTLPTVIFMFIKISSKYNNLNNFLDIPVTLSHEKYREYCSKLFKFKNIKFMRFR